MSHASEPTPGTEDLEAGMRPSSAGAFAVILVNVLLVLAILNSNGLVSWTQRLPSGHTSAWLAERAADWDRLMNRPPSDLYKAVKPYLDIAK